MSNFPSRGAVRKQVLAKQPVEPSTHERSSPASQHYRPGASHNAVYSAGAPIACFDRSPDGRSVVLGGPYILKILTLDGRGFRESVDLRAIINAQPSIRSSITYSVSDQLSVKDAKFLSGPGETAMWIFTACANSKIFHYDLTRIGAGDSGTIGLDLIRLPEDSRQVNTLDVNPHRGTWGTYLLSGSQDGTVRCFDVRTQAAGLSCHIKQNYKCYANGVRDVKWSPKDGYVFACGTEQGSVLKWDIRKSNAPLLRINGHEKACCSVSWHPDGDHVISGGWDNKCYVWDFSKSGDKRQKPKFTLSTPAPVSTVSWRPSIWSATAQSRRAAQVAVSYDSSSQKRYGISSVHVWDLARPTMPFKEIDRFDSSPSAILWHDQDALWTAGQDGMFNQVDLSHTPKLIDRQTMSTMAFSPRGDVIMFLDERPPQQRARPRSSHIPERQLPISSYSSSPTNPMLSVSRSDSEDDVISSFVGSRRQSSRRRRVSGRSAANLASTPPSSTGIPEDITLPLDQSVDVTGSFRSHQSMAFGHAPSTTKFYVYEYLSSVYLDALERELPYAQGRPSMPDRITSILNQYSRGAENVGLFRLAQTWRILSFAVSLLLTSRAQYHLDIRLGKHLKRKAADVKSKQEDKYMVKPPAPHNEETPKRPAYMAPYDGRPTAVRSLLAEEIESTSNVTTPLARPINDAHFEHHDYVPGKKLTPVLESDSFSLPPAAHPGLLQTRQRLNSEPLSVRSHDSEHTQVSSTDGYDFYDADTLSKAIDVPEPRGKGSIGLEYVEPRSPSTRRRQLARQDSNDSYGQIFSISDGSRQTTGLTGSSDGDRSHRAVTSNPKQERHGDNRSDNAEEEYESRIRGSKIEGSPEIPRLSLIRRSPPPVTESYNSKDEDYMMSQTTTTTSDSQRFSQSSDAASPVDVKHAGNPSHQNARDRQNAQGVFMPHLPESASDLPSSPVVIEADYLLWQSDPPYPFPTFSAQTPTPRSPTSPTAPPPTLDPYALIARSLAFETRTSALHASAMVLLLRPLVPDYVIDPLLAGAVLRQHHARLMGLKLFMQSAWLRNMCLQGWPASSVDQMNQREAPAGSRTTPAGSNVLAGWGDSYPAVSSPAQRGVVTAFSCSRCHKARDIDRKGIPYGAAAVWTCSRCQTAMAPCSICGHRDTSALPVSAKTASGGVGSDSADGSVAGGGDGEPVLSTWWHCPICLHGGHSSCLAGWHGLDAPSPFPTGASDVPPLGGLSDGCCPADGCGHACLPGAWRDEAAAARSDELGGKVARQLRQQQKQQHEQQEQQEQQQYQRGTTIHAQSESEAPPRHARRTASGSDAPFVSNGPRPSGNPSSSPSSLSTPQLGSAAALSSSAPSHQPMILSEASSGVVVPTIAMRTPISGIPAEPEGLVLLGPGAGPGGSGGTILATTSVLDHRRYSLLQRRSKGGTSSDYVGVEPEDEVPTSRAVEAVRGALSAGGGSAPGLGGGVSYGSSLPSTGSGAGAAGGMAMLLGMSAGSGGSVAVSSGGSGGTGSVPDHPPHNHGPAAFHHAGTGGGAIATGGLGAGHAVMSQAAGILSSSPGRMVPGDRERERERRKSVKFVAPDEQRW